MKPRNETIARLKLLQLAGLLVLPGVLLAAQPVVNGRIERVGPFRLLRVWGTPQEMGFAHGYLLADDIVAILSDDVAADPQRASEAGQQAMGALIPFIDVPDRVMEELRGILDGMNAAKGDPPVVHGLGRRFNLNDLILRNAGDMLRAYGCSGFTVWGEQAGENGVITARNFDFPIPGRRSLEAQLIIIRQPAGGKQVMSVAWPGYIGAFTGVNEEGVCTFMHDGTGGRNAAPNRKRTPLALIIADVLERTTPSDALDDMKRRLDREKDYPFSYMVRVVTPRVDGKPPARVFRVDPDGVGVNPPRRSSCITTNHYLTAADQPVEEAHPWSLKRYDRLNRRLRSAMTRDAVWTAQSDAASDDQAFPTLHTLVVYPETRMIDLAFATWRNGKFFPATAGPPVQISFDVLFAELNKTD